MKSCILSKSFLKFTRRFQFSFGSGRKGVGVDVWSVILLKVDPQNIFKCILISKSCLEVITSPYFRRKYLEKWKDSIKDCLKAVIGFMCIGGEFQLLVTNQLSYLINNTKLIKGHLEFKSKSSSGLILCVDHKTLYIFNFAPFGGSVIVTPLPPPPTDFMYSGMVIISSKDASFKVVMAGKGESGWTLTVQTFCSSTWAWQKSELSFHHCYHGFLPFLNHPGIVGKKGMVYWPAEVGDSLFLVAYDTKNPKEGCLCRIRVPGSCYTLNRYYFDSTPGRNVMCATTGYGVINILELDDEDDEAGDWNYWKLLYEIDINSVWDVNSALVLAGDEKDDNLPLFKFVSFVPGRPDSIFVARRQCLFICNIHTKKLERFGDTDYLKMDGGRPRVYVPMTMAELGVWPSSPFSNHPSRKKGRRSFSLHGSYICH